MLSDFGGFAPCQPDEMRWIGDLEDLRRAMGECLAARRSMRIRCFAHSMNGMSVPRANETLLNLAGVRHVAWEAEGVIVAGAGLSVWELDQYVRRFGWKLPVVNDGGAEAPSLGGFIAAGGIGEGCFFYGGFWENVVSLTVAIGTGEVRRFDRSDPFFPWFFGSMGTLGVVYEASLDLVPAGSTMPNAVEDVAHLSKTSTAAWPPHMWLTLFVPESCRADAVEQLNALIAAHPHAWNAHSAYEYYLLRKRFTPPLLFEGNSDFIALGIWGDRSETDSELQAYLKLESDFQALVEHSDFRRYFQAELIWTHRNLENYVGAHCAARYRVIKAELDPCGLINAFQRLASRAASTPSIPAAS